MKKFTEVIKLKEGILHHLDYHQRRMDATLSHFYRTSIDLPEEIRHRIPDSARSGLSKCRVVYGNIIESIEFSHYSIRKIKKVKIIEDPQIEYQYKYFDRSKINDLRLIAGDDFDEIIIAKNGFVTDSSFSNLVFQSQNGFFTPKNYLLNGTKRQQLIDKKEIKEITMTVDSIKRYQKVYFINAMTELEDDCSVAVENIIF